VLSLEIIATRIGKCIWILYLHRPSQVCSVNQYYQRRSRGLPVWKWHERHWIWPWIFVW